MTGVSARVVVGVDGSESSFEAVGWAARECVRHRVPLRSVHAYLVPAGAYPDFFLTTARARRRSGSPSNRPPPVVSHSPPR